MHHRIEVSQLSFGYPDGRQALQGINLSIAPGEKVALVGPNGAGKSTLLLHLAGILRGQGEVRVSSVPVSDETMSTIRSAVGLVFQDPDDQLFSASVYEDVAFGPRYMGLNEVDVAERVGTALQAVGMVGAGSRVPYHLSGGEKKRVAMATVLSMDPEILILDEPTLGLDPRGRRDIVTLLHQLPQTMLVSTHDMRLVNELFPRMVVIDEGRIVADGPTDELIHDHAAMEKHGLEAV
ncbi:MAG: ABC transporter ATP-binding protein [Anaerolineales bacterium]|jgi:cobalt transport protein ATP-binding subunit